jgi:phosphoglycerate dehydrogenase-like enzyme
VPTPVVLLPSDQGRDLLGPVPDGVEVAVWNGRTDPPEQAATAAFWVPPFLAAERVGELVAALPSLRVVQLLSAGADAFAGRLPDGVVLCDARGVHTGSTSEWAVAVILASVRELPRFVLAQAERRWDTVTTDTLDGKRVLVVGAGDIGLAIRDRLVPLGAEITLVARRARPGVHAVGELPALLPGADVVVVVVPLTEQTRGLVDAEFLARMRDGALLVNAARGPIADTDALAAELHAGRLRAAVDVTDPEPLPPDHPLWTAPGLLLTPHVGGSVRGYEPKAYTLVRRQLERWLAGEPLQNVVADGY